MACAERTEIEQVEGWHVWRSQSGRFWACRTGNVHWWDKPRESGWSMCVDADTEHDLRAELTRQRDLDRKSLFESEHPGCTITYNDVSGMWATTGLARKHTAHDLGFLLTDLEKLYPPTTASEPSHTNH
jgi:hypothetical protein